MRKRKKKVRRSFTLSTKWSQLPRLLSYADGGGIDQQGREQMQEVYE